MMVVRLVVTDSSGLALAVDVGPVTRIGRDAHCELVLADAKVSRHHATLERGGAGWQVRDAGSRHGTYVNGHRIEEAAIAGGDQLQIGDTILTFDGSEISSQVVARAVGATADQAPVDRLRIFYGLAEATRSIDDLEVMLARTLESVVAAVGGDRGLIAIAGEPGAAPRRIAEVGARELVIGRSLVEAARRGEAILVRERDGKVIANTLGAQGIRSAMIAPIGAAGQLGFLYIDSLDDPDRMAEADLELVAAIGAFVSAIVEAADRFRRAEALAEAARSQPAPVILGTSSAVLAVRREVERLGAAEIAVHVSGESGVGKELVARALHAASVRHHGPLIAVNCAAIPDNLIESELFGHARGAFTGAIQARRGKFLLADRGTLFLDEVAELSLAAQAAMLRILEDGEVQPIGAERSQTVDVRVISASHKDLRREIAAGRFREDLFYRLIVAEIRVPPLRERPGDVAAIADAMLATARRKGSRAHRLSAAAVAALRDHAWPGNVRELRNVVERAAALATGDVIEVPDLRLDAAVPAAAAPSGSLAERFSALDAGERHLVLEALEAAGGNVSQAARLLGITRIMMKRRIDRLGLSPTRLDLG